MDIYFVRHGQTSGNAARRHQAGSTPLTELGDEQALEAAKKLVEVSPTDLLASHLVRAIETARPIAAETKLEIEIDQNLAELHRPRYLEGRYHFSPQSVFYYFMWFLRIENRDLAGESYHHVRQRIAMVQNRLKQFNEGSRVVVVSHSVFINLFLAHMCRPRGMTPFGLVGVVSKIFKIPNGSITHVRYDVNAPTGTCKWQIVEK